MKIIIFIISLALIIATLTSKSFAQGVVISANESATPAASAMLDVQSTDKGLLIPRMDSTQRVAISTPATGLLVYQTDKADGFYFFNGTDWINLNGSTSNTVTKIDDLSDGRTGGNSVFLGDGAGASDDLSNNQNLALGVSALYSNTAGSSNVASGYQALYSNTTGNWNTANGAQALYFNTTGVNNTANGFRSLYSNETGNSNTANGYATLHNNTTGYENTASGTFSLYFNSTGNSNTAYGFAALQNNTTGINNTANGSLALFNNTTGNDNMANGFFALFNNTTGINNTATGVEALHHNTTGINNTANGRSALFSNTTGNDNVANGVNALRQNTTGINNVANGFAALQNNTTGSWNTAIGHQAALSKTGTDAITAIGGGALQNALNGPNTAVGHQAGINTTNGTHNVIVGRDAFYNNTSGSNNTSVGFAALGANTTGTGNTALGYQANVASGALTNATAIGANALVSQSNSLVLGSINGVNGATSDTKVGIGTAAPTELLDVNGEARVRNLEGAGFRQIYADSQGKLMVNSIEELASQSNAPGTPIVDYNCPDGVSDTIHVAGFPESVQSENICVTINLTHTFVADLEIYLIAPNGDKLNLMKNNGGGDDNLVNTQFCDNFAEPLSSSLPPYTGTFLPIGSLSPGVCGFVANVSSFSAIGGGNINPNGMWILKVFDVYGGDQGVLNNWSVELTSGDMLVDVGTNNYLPKWQNGTLTTNSSIYDNGNVGIGTTTPKTTLQVEGYPASTTTADGVQVPSLTLAQLDAKVAAYGADQDGAIIFVNDISVASTTPETADITAKGFYYYDATTNKWKGVGGGSSSSSTTYSVGDFAQGGIVFWVDETGQHGLVAAKQDQSTGVIWFAGTYGNTQAKGDGPYAGEANTSIIIAAHVAIGDDGNTYAARICNELQVTEGGKTYGDWYLPSKEELNIMYQNKATINAAAGANGGSGFTDTYYWSSSEFSSNYAWRQDFYNGFQGYYYKDNTRRVRAVRAF